MEDERGPISCETGTIEILKNPNEDLIINGAGEDCIGTAGNCNLTIDPENIILTNCENCVDARGTSDVTLLSPDGDIVFESSEDGFRGRGDMRAFQSKRTGQLTFLRERTTQRPAVTHL